MGQVIGYIACLIIGLILGLWLKRDRRPAAVPPSAAVVAKIVERTLKANEMGKKSSEIVDEINELLDEEE